MNRLQPLKNHLKNNCSVKIPSLRFLNQSQWKCSLWNQLFPPFFQAKNIKKTNIYEQRKKTSTYPHLPKPLGHPLTQHWWPITIHPSTYPSTRCPKSSGFFSSTDGAEANSAGLWTNREPPVMVVKKHMWVTRLNHGTHKVKKKIYIYIYMGTG